MCSRQLYSVNDKDSRVCEAISSWTGEAQYLDDDDGESAESSENTRGSFTRALSNLVTVVLSPGHPKLLL